MSTTDITHATDTDLAALLEVAPLTVEDACLVLRDICPAYWPGTSSYITLAAHERALVAYLAATKGSDRTQAHAGYRIEIARARAEEMSDCRELAAEALEVIRAAA